MKRLIYALLLGLFLTQSAAYAEMIRGTITSVDPTNNMFCILKKNILGRTSKELTVKFDDQTQAKNLASLDQLRIGEKVKVDAKKDKASGLLEAKSVELTAAQ